MIKGISAVVSDQNAVKSNYSSIDVFKLTYLEVGFLCLLNWFSA